MQPSLSVSAQPFSVLPSPGLCTTRHNITKCTNWPFWKFTTLRVGTKKYQRDWLFYHHTIVDEQGRSRKVGRQAHRVLQARGLQRDDGTLLSLLPAAVSTAVWFNSATWERKLNIKYTTVTCAPNCCSSPTNSWNARCPHSTSLRAQENEKRDLAEAGGDRTGTHAHTWMPLPLHSSK